MKKLLINVITAFIITILISGCKKENKNVGDNRNIIESTDSCNCEIKSITALYYNYLFNSARARNWDDLTLNLPDFERTSNGVLDANITDCRTLKEIATELKKLKPSKEQRGGADIRIVLTVNYKNNNDTTLCIGGYYADGIFTKSRIELESENTNKLLFLIKNNIGYYSWFDKDELKEMEELKDVSSTHPFIESPYYKKYKEKYKRNN